MSTDLDSLETTLDVQRAEYQIKKREIELKEKSAKWWRNPIILAALFTLLAGHVSVQISGKNDLYRTEQEKILEIATLPKSEQKSLLCAFHHSGLFKNEDIADSISLIAQDPGCTAEGYTAQKEKVAPASTTLDTKEKVAPTATTLGTEEKGAPASTTLDTNARIRGCVEASSLETASCRAYDKSGLYGRPSASCLLTLKAAKGEFFAQKTVTVLSESYRKQRGERAVKAVKAKDPEKGGIRSFSGSIKCTNKKGTGRTCQAKATVRAISYPDSCLDLSKELENITPEERQKIMSQKDGQPVSAG